MNNAKEQKNVYNLRCEICDITCRNKYDLDRHFLTAKHEKRQLSNNYEQKCVEKGDTFECKTCHFKCSKKYDWERHLQTQKHKKAEIVEKNKGKLQCECGKYYSSKSGMWMHKKKCNIINNTVIEVKEENIINKDDVLVSILKQNSELLEIIKTKMIEPSITTNSHNTNNSNNTTFNLQFFLNETCKDAMNITDFVESIKVQLEDLINLGKVGYVEGISDIIVKNLKILEVNQRPIHCTDKKRETIYVKQEDKWEKEDEEKKRLRKLIRDIAFQNQILIPQFRKVHPDCGRANSLYAEQFTRLVIESMGGSGDNDKEKEDKIIKKITNVVGIERIKA